MELAFASPESDLTAVNTRFVKNNLLARWKTFDAAPGYTHPSEHLRQIATSRGLAVMQESGASLFFDGDRCIGGLLGMRPSVSGGVAGTICASKNLTKKILVQAGLPTPGYRLFKRDEMEAARDYVASRTQDALVVKPLDGNQGKGITTGVRTPAGLDSAWARARKATKVGRLLIEDEVAGVDVRISVINGNAVAVAARIPPFVVGDGRASLAELMAELRAARAQHAYLRRLKLVPDPEYLRRAGVDHHTILASNQVQFLNGTANLSRGGVPVDITDTVSEDALRLAEQVTESIPGLGYAGVDVLMPEVTSGVGAMVIEVNTSANPLVHDLPAFGKCRRVSDSIVDEIIRRARL